MDLNRGNGLRRVRLCLDRRPGDDFPPFDYERIWVEGVGDNNYRVESIPFFALGVNRGDFVSLGPSDSQAEAVVEKVLEWGGHSTFHVIFPDDGHGDIAQVMPGTRETLGALGCGIEESGSHYFAIDVPPGAPLHAVIEMLRVGSEERVWRYEDATRPGTRHES